MKSYKFKKIDAFTRGVSAGNPAACIYPDSAADISEAEMQLIARQLKGYVSEVVYLFPERDGILLRYYSAECEVEFCGHGTVAAMYDYIGSQPDLYRSDVVRIRVKGEHLNVYNRLKEDGSVFITAPAPAYKPLVLKTGEISAALAVEASSLDSGREMALVNAGLNTLIVPLAGLEACLQMKPDEIQLKSFCLAAGIDIVLVFTQETSAEGHSYRTRVFAPKFGYLEDPATGSGNSAFGYYLLRQGAWDGRRLSIEQNGSYDCPNTVMLSTTEDGGSKKVIFGGAAAVRIEGRYLLEGA